MRRPGAQARSPGLEQHSWCTASSPPSSDGEGLPGTHPVQGAHAQLGGQQRDGGVVRPQADALLQHLHGTRGLGERRASM